MAAIRVLHILDGLNRGGAESFILNTYRFMDREQVQFDFLLRNHEGNVYADEVSTLGGRIYYLPPFPKRLFANLQALRAFLKKHNEYTVIHLHANSLIYVFPLLLAKRYGVPCRILHAHNAKTSNPVARVVHYLFRVWVPRAATHYFACSTTAARWMLNKLSNRASILPNAISVDSFAFQADTRNRTRKALNVENKFVLGHIGRFEEQKNQSFLIDILSMLVKKRSDAVLVLVGDGRLRLSLERKAKEIGLSDKIVFTGARADVADLLQAMDVFVFPSRFEGLGIVVIEAQASGLPCVISDAVPDEAKITGLVHVHSLQASAEEWAETILTYNPRINRQDVGPLVKSAGYDIPAAAAWLQAFYLRYASVQ